MFEQKTIPRWLILSLLLVILISSGCVRVDVVDQTGSLRPTEPLQHNLTALDISFDPPLDEIGRSVLRQGVNLYLTVENTGLEDEASVRVQVTLETEEQNNPLATQEFVIAAIGAGETKQAHFRLTEFVDQYPHYVLHIAVDPCSGETFLADNQRTFDLYVSPIR